MGQVVLVTGVAGDLGRRFAAQLSKSPVVERVIGIDTVPPRGDLGRADFVRADIRNPVIAKVIVRERVDTVVHTSVAATPAASGGRTSMKELNVIGTMQLLAACQQAPDVRKLVLKSSAAVYGASNRDPAMFTEGMNAKRLATSGFAKDITEVESYTRGFARRRPDVAVTTLRIANVIGPRITSAMTGYFRLPVIPTVLGFNPRLQFLHEQDALDVLEHATVTDVTGTFNVAGDGIMTLAQAVRRLGRPSLPLPGFAVPTFGSAIRQTRRADFSPEQVAFLTFGRGLDTTRMRSMLGFEPSFTHRRGVRRLRRLGDARYLRPRARPGHRVRTGGRTHLRRGAAVGDAEIIPIGTRGKPGRGTGDAKPSSNSRSLAAKAPARRPAARQTSPAVSEPSPDDVHVPAQKSQPKRPRRSSVAPAGSCPQSGSTVLGRPGRRDARSCPGDHRPPPPVSRASRRWSGWPRSPPRPRSSSATTGSPGSPTSSRSSGVG